MGESEKGFKNNDKFEGDTGRPAGWETDWDRLAKEVPFAGFGSRERQKLHEEGRIKDTGAYVLGDDGEIVGVLPSLPEKYEKTNMKYAKTMGDELYFLQSYMDDKKGFLEDEKKKLYNGVMGDVSGAWDRQHEQEMKLRAETEYVDGLMRYFRTADEATRADLSKGDVVFDKIKDDIAAISGEIRQREEELGKAGFEIEDLRDAIDEAKAKRRARQRIFGVLRAKFDHHAKFTKVDGEFAPVYDEASSVESSSGKPTSDAKKEFEQRQEMVPWAGPKVDPNEERRRRKAKEMEEEEEEEDEMGMEM